MKDFAKFLAILGTAVCLLVGFVYLFAPQAVCPPTRAQMETFAVGTARLNVREAETSPNMLVKFAVPKSGKGRVVQSITMTAQDCNFIASSSLGGTPERVKLWLFGQAGFAIANTSSRDMGHGNDLSRALTKDGEEVFWVSNQSGRGALRFHLVQEGTELRVKSAQNIEFIQEPLRNNMIQASPDGRYLLMMGRELGETKTAVIVRVFDLDKVNAALADGAASIDLTQMTPLYTWRPDPKQRASSNWRQGLASVGDRVFILSGNAKPNAPKYLGTYGIDGKKVSLRDFKIGKSEALRDDGAHYEPEGLEFVIVKDKLHLGVGIASGPKGGRIYRLWAVPVETE